MNILEARISLDFRSDEPLYLQIVRQIEKMVVDRILKPGDQLPTVREMAIDLRINFSTVARAYRLLDEQKLISTQRGRGTYIWDRVADDTQPHPKAPNFPSEKLAGLAQKFVREAIESGSSGEEIKQVVLQQLENWIVNK